MSTMGRPKHTYSFGYDEIADLTGISNNAVSKAVARELLDPDDLLSVAAYIAAHGTEGARMEIMQALIRSGDYIYRGRPKDSVRKRK